MTAAGGRADPPIGWQDNGATIRVEVNGAWIVSRAQLLDHALAAVPLPSGAGRAIELELGAVAGIDTVGAWLIYRTITRWRAQGHQVTVGGASPALDVLLTQVAKAAVEPPPQPKPLPTPIRQLTCLGRDVTALAGEAARLFEFVGMTIAALLRILGNPRRLRITSTFAQMWSVGISAMPIVGLISFLIGVVIAFQGVDLLRTFGAEIYVVNLVGISVLRELGILLTAIVVAGRSGSSFTAQIGSMKLREEVDAMRTLGLDPMDVLVIPRVLALGLMLPCLTFFADMMGLAGGVVMSWVALGIAPPVFFDHLLGAITWKSFAVGMIKAPFFAVTIAIVGCLEGLAVEGSAESVGQRTTTSVVKSIFLVIVIDAAFSIFFSAIHF